MNNTSKRFLKRIVLLLALCSMLTVAMADWTYGTARFKGNQPSSSMTVGTVRIWYKGTLSQTGIEGNVEIWQGTGDICVVFPKDYNGRQMRFFSSGGNVQIQTLR